MSPAITITYHIKPPTAVDRNAFPTSGEASFPLEAPPPPQPYSVDGAINPTDPISPLNSTLSPYFSSLVHTLSAAQTELNARLTDWKELIVNGEKEKEVAPAAAMGKKGMGKAMMMVLAAKEADGRAQEERGTQVASGQLEGLPVDDGDEDSDDEDDLMLEDA